MHIKWIHMMLVKVTMIRMMYNVGEYKYFEWRVLYLWFNVRLQLHTLGGSTAKVKVVTNEEEERDVSQDAPRGRWAMDLIWTSNLSQVGEFFTHLINKGRNVSIAAEQMS